MFRNGMKAVGTRALAAAFVALALASAAFAANVGSSFTYQGSLLSSSSPANGTYDFKFSLFDAANAGNQVGSTQNASDINVVDGLFTTALDFGAGSFVGQDRWLEIQVSPNDGNFTTLSPRQKLTATPFAMYAMAPWITNGSNVYYANGPVGVGPSTPGAGLHVTTSKNGLSFNATDNLFVNSSKSFVGVNRSSQQTSAESFGIYSPNSGGSYGGMYNKTDADGLPFYGYTDGSTTAWTYLDCGTGDWSLHLAGDDRFRVTAAGDVGINVDNPTARLDVVTKDGTGIHCKTTAASSIGIDATGTTAGVKGESGASDGYGVYGRNGTNGGEGVRGSAGDGGGAGIAGYGNFGTGVYGQTSQGYGVYGSNGGSNSDGYAGYFNGRLHVNGTLSKNGGSFKIDHPLDPSNKYLYHSFVESPDMMNIYNGVVALDSNGEAVISMPEWFEALNMEFRYQLTCIGGFAPVYIAEEMANNQFKVGGGKPGMKVSWQVTGIRHDAYADAHRIQVEETKVGAEKGTYLHPELFGQPMSSAVPAHSNQLKLDE